MTKNKYPLPHPPRQEDEIKLDEEQALVEEITKTGFAPPECRDDGAEVSEPVLSPEELELFQSAGSPEQEAASLFAKFSQRLNASALGSTESLADSTRALRQSLEETASSNRSELPIKADELKELKLKSDENSCPGMTCWNWEYEIKSCIGKGGQGTVHLLHSVDEPNLPKALKIFSPDPYASAESYYRDMFRMSKVAAELYRMQAENLVIIEKTRFRNDIFEMVMRWIDGLDLRALLRPHLLTLVRKRLKDDQRWEDITRVVLTPSDGKPTCLKPGMAVKIIEKCLRALDALHSESIVHGDIKPSNIMLDKYGSIRLIDIGSAFQTDDPPEQHTWTPRYAPPEIFEGAKWTPQSDLASLGYVLVELLCGRLSLDDHSANAQSAVGRGSKSTRMYGTDWRGRQQAEKRQLPAVLDQLLPADVRKSDRLMSIIRKLIDPDLNKRFSSAADALEGPVSTHQFQQDLTRASLSLPWSLEIKRWMIDMMRPLQP